MKKQGGQDIVEFALMLPLFFIFIYCIMYCGFLFGDYITLNNEARSAAREAVIGVSSKNEKDSVSDYYNGVIKNYDKEINDKGIITHLYVYEGMLISDGTNTASSIKTLTNLPGNVNVPENSVIVIVKTEMNSDFLVAQILEQHHVPLISGYEIKYIMYNENGTKSNS
ncbi:TadE/TadG family type IV pilus assembly protein [uncultured Dialister sp.]|uniref:TadE/TadG family type IV pilus assembly protein n=1 Tax=uncultured Dialister sp. TaxID=278064 RepID=UPI0025837F4E|nr:TadE/TadG family type IV pilus assembly protein [uncultured Dialister sp.]